MRRSRLFVVVVFLISCTVQSYISKAVNNGRVFEFWRYYKKKEHRYKPSRRYYFTRVYSEPSVLSKIKTIINEY